MKARAIKIEFDKEDDWWMAQCSDGIGLEEAVRMVREAWVDHEAPLITDEKIRRAVRAWAEANDIERVSYYKSSHYWYLRSFNDHEQGIDFWLSYDAEPEMIENEHYTIDQLCGKEEE